MLTPNVRVQAFASAVETILRDIRQIRPDLDLTLILTWANRQALNSPNRDTLYFLDQAYNAVQRLEPLPWLPAEVHCHPPE